jgi:prophage regulatory protein
LPPAASLLSKTNGTTTNMRHLHKIIRLRELPDYVGLKRSQIDALIIKGEFPRPIKLSDGGRAKGWLEHEIIAWQQERLAKRDADIGTKCQS